MCYIKYIKPAIIPHNNLGVWGMKVIILIKEVRNQNGITLRQLSELSGVSKSQISLIENGDSNPTLLVMCMIARGLQTDIGNLYRIEE